MHSVREPVFRQIEIADLRPTQITVGMHEVMERRRRWKAVKDRDAFLAHHLIPVVLGPKARHYVIDHHHLARALLEEGVKRVFVTVTSDLSQLAADSFWFVLDNRGLMHPFDDRGERRSRHDIPKSVDALIDDPYRSLAGALRRAGGYAKDTTPFSEFLWADFFRERIKRKHLEENFGAALKKALQLAKKPDANYLPGWCGPVEHD